MCVGGVVVMAVVVPINSFQYNAALLSKKGIMLIRGSWAKVSSQDDYINLNK